jgi:hypothetical protein
VRPSPPLPAGFVQLFACGRRKCLASYIVVLSTVNDKLAGVPGVDRDKKLQKQIFEIAWREKGWIG